MWAIEGSWGGVVDALADVWVLEGDRRVVTQRGALRLASAKRAARPSRLDINACERRRRKLDARRLNEEPAHELLPGWEVNLLPLIISEGRSDSLKFYVKHDYIERYLRYLVRQGATSLHVALVGRIMTRLDREVAGLGQPGALPRLLNSRQAELVVAIRARTVTAEMGTRLVAFFEQLRAWWWIFDAKRSPDPDLDLEPAFDASMSMMRLDADLLEAALLAASRIELDARTAIAALFVLETGMSRSELSRLSNDQVETGEESRRSFDGWGKPFYKVSPALFNLARSLTQRNEAIRDFAGWLSEGSTLFQARESVRSRSLEASWFTDALRRMSVTLWQAGLQSRPRSLDLGGLQAHHKRRTRDPAQDGEGFAAWSKRVAFNVFPAEVVRSAPLRLPVWVLD